MLFIPSGEAMDVALLDEDAVEWVVEAAAASLVEVAASLGSTGNRSAVVAGHFTANSMAEVVR